MQARKTRRTRRPSGSRYSARQWRGGEVAHTSGTRQCSGRYCWLNSSCYSNNSNSGQPPRPYRLRFGHNKYRLRHNNYRHGLSSARQRPVHNCWRKTRQPPSFNNNGCLCNNRPWQSGSGWRRPHDRPREGRLVTTCTVCVLCVARERGLVIIRP